MNFINSGRKKFLAILTIIILIVVSIFTINILNPRESSIVQNSNSGQSTTFDSYFSQLFQPNTDTIPEHTFKVEENYVQVDFLKMELVGKDITKASEKIKLNKADDTYLLGNIDGDNGKINIFYTDDITKVKSLAKVVDIKTFAVNNAQFAGMMVREFDGKSTPVAVVVNSNSSAFIFELPDRATESQLVTILNKVVLETT